MRSLVTTFVSYITAFVIIGMYWITYHSVFNPIRDTTDLMIWLNLSFLLLIALIPFSVRLIDKYDNQVSFIIYSLMQVPTGMMLFLIWQHAIRKRILQGKSNDGNDTINSIIIRLTYIRTITIPIVFIISIIISFYYLDIASVLPLTIIPISLIIRFRFRNHDKLYVEEA